MSYHEQEAVNLYKCGANDNRVELEIEMISKHERLNNGSVLHYDSTNKAVYDPDSILMHEVFIKLALNSIPSIVAMIVEYSIFSLNVVFIGYLDDPVAMSGCGLGGMTANILAYSLGVGICGGIDTLVSQAFGRKDYESCKIYLIFSKILMVFLFIPQFIIFFFSEDLFVFIGQPEESANVAWKYLMTCLPGLFFNIQFECIRRYLLAMGVYYPTMIILIITFFIHILCLCFFVLALNMGIIGVGVATSITYTMNFVLTNLYAEFQSNPNLKASWKFNRSILKLSPEFLKYGLTSCIALFLFWWPFELTIIYGGWLGFRQSAGSTILNSFSIILSNVPYGIALTASSIVGYSLGANLPNKAKKSTLSACIFGFLTSLCICIIVFIFRYEIMHIYTNDQELVELIDGSIFEFIIMLFLSLFNCSINGVLRGMGYQNLLVIFCFVSFWLITLPLTMALLFVWDYNFRGIWTGLMIGNCSFIACNIGVLLLIDWKKLAQEKSKKIHEAIEDIDINIELNKIND